MTERQRRFVDYYLQTGQVSQAARLAGYTKKSARYIGSELIAKPYIQEEVERRLKEMESERIAETKEILEHLTAVIRGEITEEVSTASGKKIRAKVREQDRLRAAELLLRVRGEFRDKVDMKVDGAQLFINTLETVWSEDASRSDG